jgi:hypothetical protein
MDQDNVVAFPQAGVLEPTDPAQAGLRKDALDRLARIIEGHIAENRYPGAQIAIARHSKLALYRSWGAGGRARRAGAPTPHPVAALFQHQGRDRLRGMAVGRGRGAELP